MHLVGVTLVQRGHREPSLKARIPNPGTYIPDIVHILRNPMRSGRGHSDQGFGRFPLPSPIRHVFFRFAWISC